MNTKKIITGLLLVGSLGLFGCGETPKYVNPNGPNLVVTMEEINEQEWDQAAAEMVNDYLNDGGAMAALGNVGRKPAVFAISKIVNSTDQRVDTDKLTKKVAEAFRKTGKLQRTALFSDEDPMAKETKATDDFAGDRRATNADRPDFSMSGKIMQDKVRAGDLRQTTYTFELRMIDRRANVVWEHPWKIVKQGTKSGVGF